MKHTVMLLIEQTEECVTIRMHCPDCDMSAKKTYPESHIHDDQIQDVANALMASGCDFNGVVQVDALPPQDKQEDWHFRASMFAVELFSKPYGKDRRISETLIWKDPDKASFLPVVEVYNAKLDTWVLKAPTDRAGWYLVTIDHVLGLRESLQTAGFWQTRH